MKEINAIGIECPMPVIMAKRLVDQGEENFLVLVNEDIAVENLQKMAKQMDFDTKVTDKDGGVFQVEFIKTENSNIKEEKKEKDSYIVVFDSDKIGEGDEELSKKLVEAFILALSEQEDYPDYVICFNRGVYLTTQRENTIEDLKKLENSGVKVLSCGLCLDNYSLKEDLKVGKVTNMYEICNLMTTKRVVKP